MAICVFSTISYSIVKCSFVCLFVNALDPCKINIEKYTSVMLFLRFPAKYSPNYSRTLTCAHVCLSVWLCVCNVWLWWWRFVSVCVCVSVCLYGSLQRCVCVCHQRSLQRCVRVCVCLNGCFMHVKLQLALAKEGILATSVIVEKINAPKIVLKLVHEKSSTC